MDNLENITSTNSTTIKPKATIEGMFIAYSSLLIMSLLPIYFGAFRSVAHQLKQKNSGEKPELMTKKDAAMFPIYASFGLFGIYIVFQIFSKEYVNTLLTCYFFVLGVVAVAKLINPGMCKLASPLNQLVNLPLLSSDFHLTLLQREKDTSIFLIDEKFDGVFLYCIILSSIFGVWYLIKKHWIANNIFGLAFALTGIEFLHLNNILIGCILLCGLFIYDIFWVFGTNVMVSVAKSFEAPIKLVFPQDLLENGLAAKNFAMLGLGDIVIPGIFIALLLRFDVSLKRQSRSYFNVTFVAYILGLLVTICVMHLFKHAQPALLYLVPACITSPLLCAVVKGDFKDLISYEDHPSDEGESVIEEKESALENKKSD